MSGEGEPPTTCSGGGTDVASPTVLRWPQTQDPPPVSQPLPHGLEGRGSPFMAGAAVNLDAPGAVQQFHSRLVGSFSSPQQQQSFLPAPLVPPEDPRGAGGAQLLGLEELTRGATATRQLAQSLPPIFTLPPIAVESQLDMRGGPSVGTGLLNYGHLARDSSAASQLHSPMPQRLGFTDMESLLRAKRNSAENIPDLLARLPALAETCNLLPPPVCTDSRAGDTWAPAGAGVGMHGGGTCATADPQALNQPGNACPEPPEVREGSGVQARTGVGGQLLLPGFAGFGEPHHPLVATSHMSPHESSASSDTNLHDALLRSSATWTLNKPPAGGPSQQEDLTWATPNTPTLSAGATLSSLPRSPSLLPQLPPPQQLPAGAQLAAATSPRAPLEVGLWEDIFGTRSSISDGAPMATDSSQQFNVMGVVGGGVVGPSPLGGSVQLPQLTIPPPNSMSLGLSSFGGPLKAWESVGAASLGGGGGVAPVSPRATSFTGGGGEQGLVSPQQQQHKQQQHQGSSPAREDLPPPGSGEDWESAGGSGKRKLLGGAGLTKLDAGHTVINKRKALTPAEWEGSSPSVRGSPSSHQSPQLRPRLMTPGPSSPSLSGGGSQGLPLPPPQMFGNSGPGPAQQQAPGLWTYGAGASGVAVGGAQLAAPGTAMVAALRQRHVAMDTRSVKERQRRVNVKEGMRQLQDLLPQRDVIMDKVTLLAKAVTYIRELQEKVRMYEAQAEEKPEEPAQPPEDHPDPPESPSNQAEQS